MDCFTNYVFISDKKIDCERFIKQLKTWMINNNNKKDISFKNLLSKANLNYKLYDYTGEISYISNTVFEYKNKFICTIDTETMWTPSNNIWNDILDKYFPNITYYYFTDNMQDDIYESNDINHFFFDYDYRVNICIDEEYSYNFPSDYIFNEIIKEEMPKFYSKKELKEDILKYFNISITNNNYKMSSLIDIVVKDFEKYKQNIEYDNITIQKVNFV